MSVVVRQIRTNDLPLLETFLRNAGRSLTTFRYFEKRPLSVIENHLVTALAMEGELPVGYGHLDKDGNRIWLGIAMIEAAAGKGYGKQMMEFLVSYAKQSKVDTLHLSVDKDNTNAIKLYEKYGFSVLKDINERSVLMSLENI